MIDSTPSTPGVLPGITLEQGLSIRPEALVLEADKSHYNKVFSQILTSLQAISDRVERAELGTAYVRLDGLAHLYGGEARLVNALLNAVPQDLAPRVGVAEAKFPAFVTATVSEPSRATRAPADTASFLAPRPVDLLPVSADLKVALHRFGLHTLGGRSQHDRGGPDGSVRDRGPKSVAALPRDRRQPSRAHGPRRGHSRTHLPTLLLCIPGSSPHSCGYPSGQGFYPIHDTGPLRRQSRSSVRPGGWPYLVSRILFQGRRWE